MKEISNWGKYPYVKAQILSTSNAAEVFAVIKEEESIIARGNGRSYGDASLQKKIFSTLNLRQILRFDKDQGIIEAECGVLLSDILQKIVPEGFFLPVVPGTKYISLGGAIAADIHGKNHPQSGCLSKHIISFELLTASGEVLICSPTRNKVQFWNTCGGMGLTGIILRATIQLKKIESSYLRKRTIKVKSLEEMFHLFESQGKNLYTVAWLDAMGRNENLGKGIVSIGQHLPTTKLPASLQSEPLRMRPDTAVNLPFDCPSFLLNNWSLKAFNTFFYYKHFSKEQTRIVHFYSFFFPLDAIGDWNRIYGKKGLVQYQFVLPLESSLSGIKKILTTVSKSGEQAFLAVLKLLGPGDPDAIMSFPIAGFTLALDFKVSSGLFRLLDHLDQMVLAYGGRVYLAKDARMSANFFRQSYSKTVPQNERFQSLQSIRLSI